MRAIIERPPEAGAALPPFWKRLAWFFGLAISAMLTTAAVAYSLKALLR